MDDCPRTGHRHSRIGKPAMRLRFSRHKVLLHAPHRKSDLLCHAFARDVRILSDEIKNLYHIFSHTPLHVNQCITQRRKHELDEPSGITCAISIGYGAIIGVLPITDNLLSQGAWQSPLSRRQARSSCRSKYNSELSRFSASHFSSSFTSVSNYITQATPSARPVELIAQSHVQFSRRHQLHNPTRLIFLTHVFTGLHFLFPPLYIIRTGQHD